MQPDKNLALSYFRSTQAAVLRTLTVITFLAMATVSLLQPGEAWANDKGERFMMVVFSTTLGDITLELDAEKAPISVDNFLAYVDSKFFDGTIFHRVIPGFMAQGGGMTPDMKEKPTRAPIKNEADNGLTNDRGTISMARTSDVNSATSQFFLNVNDNTFLNHGSRDFGYAVFGRVVEGMDVLDKIVATPTGNQGFHQDVPKTPILINTATRK
ncbi:MAG: peptidylprolyl isomerase [Magnetococcales bacterium]|nr:peptidylprolyl isomerase [Magnetococcales bacterium]